MSWFYALTGFNESTPIQVRKSIYLDGEKLISQANGKIMTCGRLETPSLAELRKRVFNSNRSNSKILVSELVADVQTLHEKESNAGSMFQVASQFNLLEMVSPHVTPEHGVGIYENDFTQGPACAIAAGAGTIYRNYFAPVNGQIGQSRSNQIDCLADLGKKLGNSENNLWQMRNGYVLASRNGLVKISNLLRKACEQNLDEYRKLLRIGIQWNTQVTLDNCTHLVSQIYCSALPVAYSNHSPDLWEDFARLVLEASYEATICATILNYRYTGSNRVFLTLLGGGSFGNKINWIIEGMRYALQCYQDCGIEVAIVSYRKSNEHVRKLAEQFQA